MIALYLDDDFLGDAIQELGGKNGKPNLSKLIVNYLTNVYNFEKATTKPELMLALRNLLGTYKFLKAVAMGRVRVWLEKATKDPLRFDEEDPIASLDPAKSPFVAVGPMEGVDDPRKKFEQYVAEQIKKILRTKIIFTSYSAAFMIITVG